jgi:hypothetical protein
MKRFIGTKEGQVWIAGHVPELERPPHSTGIPSHQPPSSLDKELNVLQPVRKELREPWSRGKGEEGVGS